jgi:hypothetical protein
MRVIVARSNSFYPSVKRQSLLQGMFFKRDSDAFAGVNLNASISRAQHVLFLLLFFYENRRPKFR